MAVKDNATKNPSSHAWDEYKLVQDKIDRIGDFRFRVRGWALTLVAGLLAAGLSKGAEWWWAFLLAEVPVFAFHLLERTQSAYQHAFVTRASELEEHLRQGEAWPSPGVVAIIGRTKRRLRRRWSSFILAHDETAFYVLMYTVPILAIVVIRFLAERNGRNACGF